MRTLLLLRHAKSSWANDLLPDHDRPLNHRGRRDAARIGKFLESLELMPDLIITSTAERAVATAEAVAMARSFDGEVVRTAELYLAPPEAYIDLAREVDDSVAILMMVGHNPGIEELVEMIGDRGEHIPTATLVSILFPVLEWGEIDLEGDNEIRGIWTPADFPLH